MSDVTGLRPGSIVGEAVTPPFAVLPHSPAPFIHRSMRLAAWAPADDLALSSCLPAKLTAKACEKCGSYVKVLDQVNDRALAAFADDMATVGCDMSMAPAGEQWRGENLFLLGY